MHQQQKWRSVCRSPWKPAPQRPFAVTGWRPEHCFRTRMHFSNWFRIRKADSARSRFPDRAKTIARIPQRLRSISCPSLSSLSHPAFSPNGDGLNDYFGPRFIRDHAILDFSIFNRWGQRVYTVAYKQQLGMGWDGSYKGVKCDLGTYYYTLTIENPKGEKRTLKKETLPSLNNNLQQLKTALYSLLRQTI